MMTWCLYMPGRLTRVAYHRFRSSVRDRPNCSQQPRRRSSLVAQVFRSPMLLMSGVDVSRPSDPGRDGVPMGRSDGRPTSTRHVGWSSPRPHGRFGDRVSRGDKAPSRWPSTGHRTGDRLARTRLASLQRTPWLLVAGCQQALVGWHTGTRSQPCRAIAKPRGSLHGSTLRACNARGPASWRP